MSTLAESVMVSSNAPTIVTNSATRSFSVSSAYTATGASYALGTKVDAPHAHESANTLAKATIFLVFPFFIITSPLIVIDIYTVGRNSVAVLSKFLKAKMAICTQIFPCTLLGISHNNDNILIYHRYYN